MKLVRLSKVILNKFLDIFVVFHFLSIKNLKLEYHDCERKDLANFRRQQISSNTMQYLQKYPEFRENGINVIGKSPFCRKLILITLIRKKRNIQLQKEEYLRRSSIYRYLFGRVSKKICSNLQTIHD